MIASGSLFQLPDEIPTENDEFIQILYTVKNLGTASDDSITINLQSTDITGTNTQVYRIQLPDYETELILKVPVKEKPGLHVLELTLDSESEIDEIYENDNTASISFNINATDIRPILYDNYFSGLSDSLVFLNPVISPGYENPVLLTEIDTSENFANSVTIESPVGKIATGFSLSNLQNNNRYFFRSKIKNSSIPSSKIYSFSKTEQPAKYQLNNLTDLKAFDSKGLILNNSSIGLSKENIVVEVQSGGGDVAKYGSINVNGVNVLPNTFNWGMGIAVFDTLALKLDTAKTFWYGDNTSEALALAALINSVPVGKLVVMNVIDDGASNLIPELKNAIKSLGSTKVDSITFRSPWILMAVKGGLPGDVIENVKARTYPNILVGERSFEVRSSEGTLMSDVIGPSSLWETLYINKSTPLNSHIDLTILGINQLDIDTLKIFTNPESPIDLSFIDPLKYPEIKFHLYFKVADNGDSPELSDLSIDYTGAPEIATNYQLLSLSPSVINQGDVIAFDYEVANVGESESGNFSIAVDLLGQNNSLKNISNINVESILPGGSLKFSLNYNTSEDNGNRYFQIRLDSGNNVKELYEDNNTISFPFFVKGDTAKPYINLTFDGREIYDGDFISAAPVIKVELSDLSPLEINDTSAISIKLDGRPVYYSENTDIINYSSSPDNPKFTMEYRPELKDGDHTLTVFGMDPAGNAADSNGTEKHFTVSTDPELLYLYNYPNPFSGFTYFTFKLTQIPDELRISVYTIAGRLVKELVKNSSELNFDFNRIYWDGSDEDGDLLANGVYLYSAVMKKGDKSEKIIQKLAIIR